MSSSWPKDGTSIVLLPDEPLGSKVLEAAKEWTRQRLLRPALYVTCSEQNSEVFAEYQPGNPLPILATVVGLNGHRQRNLFDELSDSQLETLRVLAVRHVSKSNINDEKQLRLTNRIGAQVRRAASIHEERDRGGVQRGTQLLLVNMLIGSSGLARGGKIDHAETVWDVNVIVAPEDRSFPTGIDSFVVESDPKYVGFLLANIASSLGLWVGANKTVLDNSEIDRSATFDKYILQRTFVRAVKTDDVAVKVAAAALKQIEQHGSPLADANFHIQDRSLLSGVEKDSVIKAFVEKTLTHDGGALACKLEKKPPHEEQIKIGFLAGVKLFGRFFLDNLIALPRNLITSIVETFNKKATDVLFGPEGEFTVDVREDLKNSRTKLRRYGILPGENDDMMKISDVRGKVKARLADIPLAVDYRFDHSPLWRAIRTDLVKLLQGNSEIAKGKVIASTRELIPEEGSSWQVPEFARDIDEDPEIVQSSLNWLDAELALKLSGQFKEVISELQEQSRLALSELLAAEQEKERAKKWVRKSRSELGKTESRKRGLRRILDELHTPSKSEVQSV
jgi:hypothetical protein